MGETHTMNTPPFTKTDPESLIRYIEQQLQRSDIVRITRAQAYAILESLKNA